MRASVNSWILHLRRFIFSRWTSGHDAVADVGNNSDLYAANQESTDLINEVHMEEAPLRFMGQDVLYFQSLSHD